tara:strand:+ start:13832 stop:15244 length:1413 start_codon:yes stop_codon:yes gene_type:complete
MNKKNINFNKQELVTVVGLGFVGSAMSVAISTSKNKIGKNNFVVYGLERKNKKGKKLVKKINKGIFPFKNEDSSLEKNLKNSVLNKTLIATTDKKIINKSDVVVIDIEFNIDKKNKDSKQNLNKFIKSISQILFLMKKESLLLIETTIPPGVCENIIHPELNKILKKRNMPKDSICLAFSYERVMPGARYLDSITNFWRVYSGINKKSKLFCRKFLTKIINTKKYPLKELSKITEVETAKILENTYRATNIALIDEWSRFSEMAGIDLYEVINSIKVRPTHNNIMYPGLGVGGYCLPKDPLLAEFSARNIFNSKKIKFPITNMTIDINANSPLEIIKVIKKFFKKNIKDKRIIILGVSYKEDVCDFRNSPTIQFCEKIRRDVSNVFCHDPYIEYEKKNNIIFSSNLSQFKKSDIIIFAVKHSMYQKLDVIKYLRNSKSLIIDTSKIINNSMQKKLKEKKIKVFSLGKGIT